MQTRISQEDLLERASQRKSEMGYEPLTVYGKAVTSYSKRLEKKPLTKVKKLLD